VDGGGVGERERDAARDGRAREGMIKCTEQDILVEREALKKKNQRRLNELERRGRKMNGTKNDDVE
jgi:hypothetical protein